MTAQFDLIEQGWLPCEHDVPGRGVVTELGILPAIAEAHQLRGLRGELATQDFALVRLLLAVLHAALRGPRTVSDWHELWAAPRLPVDLIAGYLDRHRDRFDLLHPRTPFYQVADLRTEKGQTSVVERLVAEMPTGTPMFSRRRAGPGEVSLGFAEAARWLVHCQAFDVAGIKSGAVGDPRVRGGKTFPIGPGWAGRLGGWLVEGPTLRETLLLNLAAGVHGPWARDPDVDVPVWERAPHGAAEQQPGRAPTGPVDLYTWQSRRIRLITTGTATDPTGAADVVGRHDGGNDLASGDGGRVTRVIVANGDALEPDDLHGVEPHTVWRANPPRTRNAPAVHTPLAHRDHRPAWRSLPALLPPPPEPSGGDVPQPGGLQQLAVGGWVGHLVNAGVLGPEVPLRLRAIGMVYGVQRAVITDIVDDTAVVPAAAFTLDGAHTARTGVEAARDAARAIARLAGDLVAAAGGDSGGPHDRALKQTTAELTPLVLRWLAGLRADSDPHTALADLRHQVLDVVSREATDLLDNLPRGAWQGREVNGRTITPAHAEALFQKALGAALNHL